MKCSVDFDILHEIVRDTIRTSSYFSDFRVVSRTISCNISESLLHFNSFFKVYTVQCTVHSLPRKLRLSITEAKTSPGNGKKSCEVPGNFLKVRTERRTFETVMKHCLYNFYSRCWKVRAMEVHKWIIITVERIKTFTNFFILLKKEIMQQLYLYIIYIKQSFFCSVLVYKNVIIC